MGGFVSFVVAVLNVVATPLGGGGPTLPLWGRVVTYMIVSCVWVVGVGGVFCFNWISYDEFGLVGSGD